MQSMQTKNKNMNYYNTTKEKGKDLEQYQAKAKTQDQKILDIFKRHKAEYSASQIWGMLSRECPITSVRRSLSNLSKEFDALGYQVDNLLIKTENKIKGIYSRNEYKYKLK